MLRMVRSPAPIDAAKPTVSFGQRLSLESSSRSRKTTAAITAVEVRNGSPRHCIAEMLIPVTDKLQQAMSAAQEERSIGWARSSGT